MFLLHLLGTAFVQRDLANQRQMNSGSGLSNATNGGLLEQALGHEIDQSLKAVGADDSVLTRFKRFRGVLAMFHSEELSDGTK